MYNLFKKIFNTQNGLLPIVSLVIALGSLQVFDHYNLTKKVTLDSQAVFVNRVSLF